MTILHHGQALAHDALLSITGPGLRDAMTERVAQIDAGFTLAHDRAHTAAQLAAAAISYGNTAADQLAGRDYSPDERPDTWPWEGEAWRPADARANAVKGIALWLAVLDRIDGVGA